MPQFGSLEKLVRRNVSLARRTTFGIGGRAAFLMDPPDERLFAEAYAVSVRSGLPVYVLGGGSNILVADEGIEGVVLGTRKLKDSSLTASGDTVRVRAGTNLNQVVRWTARLGLAGLEGLVGIPGTIGGATRMNAGGRYGSIGDCIEKVWCAGRDGDIVTIDADDVAWGYRVTDIDRPILAIELRLKKDEPREIKRRLRKALDIKRMSQPVRERSAGCFFKNPPGDSAGRLIDSSGLKGHRVGKACVSPKHANFIINKGGANAADVMTLQRTICRRVNGLFDIRLESEVCCWPAALG